MSGVWGVSMVKDEADIIEQTIRHLHGEQLAGLIVLDNASTDGTRGILDELSRDLRPHGSFDPWLYVVDDPEPGYWQSSKMTSAAMMARGLGATWIVPFDADEIWYDPAGRPLGEAILLDDDGAVILGADLYDHRCTSLDPDAPLEGDDPFTRMGWREAKPIPLPKVAIRASHLSKIHMGNHGADLIGGPGQPFRANAIQVRHFPYRSVEQFLRKARNGAAAINATTMPRSTCQHWREYGEALDAGGADALIEWWRSAFFFDEPAAMGLVYDPAPVRWEHATLDEGAAS